MSAPNPLLAWLGSSGLPPFAAIRPEHAEAAVDILLDESRKCLTTLENLAEPRWENLAAPLEEVEDRLHRAFQPAGHLNHVMNSEAWRAAYNACLPKLSTHATELGQNAGLYRGFERLAASPEFATLSQAQKKIIENNLRDFRLSGVALPSAQKDRFKQIQNRLSELQTKFEENLLDATQAWSKLLPNEEQLVGLPERARQQARVKAQARNQPKNFEGWLLTLDYPSYQAVVTYAQDRKLREEVYAAYVTRASDQGPQACRYDNRQLMEEILALRHEAAQLLGFSNFAEKSLATKMAKQPAEVLGFLRDLARRARLRAETELAELKAYAARAGIADLQAWDMSYYAEKLRQDKFAVSDEALRPYFPAPRVIAGLFEIARRLYDVRLTAIDAEVWHPDVQAYALNTGDGTPIGHVYLDLYARENKRGGAWMDDCRGRRRHRTGLQIPIAFLTCNFTPPLGDAPSLLTHDEVATLFHEFGHGLQHLLTRVDYAGVSGINGVAWDAVELPSQFMENWCWERPALDLFARHHQTSEPLPEDLFQKLHAARNFHSALMLLRQVEFSLFDFLLHLNYQPAQGARIQETLDAVRDEVAVLRPPSWNRFPQSFSHIFAGGYAAGYYSYKWAEVLSADAYSVFEETSIFDPSTAARFRNTILAQGGSREAMDLFVEFRGRPPSIEPLLRHSGLLDEAA
ncbi:MAG: M3 family metallopeptidase [Nevskiales bacterium]